MQQNDREVFISEWLQPPHFVGNCALSSARDSGCNPNGICAPLPHGMQLTELFPGPQPSSVRDLKHSPGLPGMVLGGGDPTSPFLLPAHLHPARWCPPCPMGRPPNLITALLPPNVCGLCALRGGKKVCQSNAQINTTPSWSIYQKEKQVSSVGSFWLLLFQHTRMQGSVIYYLRLTNNFSIL